MFEISDEGEKKKTKGEWKMNGRLFWNKKIIEEKVKAFTKKISRAVFKAIKLCRGLFAISLTHSQLSHKRKN